MRNTFLFIALLFFVASCNNTNQQTTENNDGASYEEAMARMNSNYHKVKILEVLQTDKYSYLRLDENGKELWAAINAAPVEVGDTYYYKDAMEMKNFESKSLGRVFESIWFVNEIQKNPPQEQKPMKKQDTENDHNKVQDISKEINVEKANGGYSLAEIFEKKSELADQMVLVRGQVVKINQAIMKTNWIHIQDGTKYNGIFDLTVTTDENINFKVGDVVTFEGKLVLNKDFGYGYNYDYLVEHATIK